MSASDFVQHLNVDPRWVLEFETLTVTCCSGSFTAVSADNQVAAMKAIVESLPEENYASLQYLIAFLAQVKPSNPFAHLTLSIHFRTNGVTVSPPGVGQQRSEQDDQQQPGRGVWAQPPVGAGQRHVPQCHRTHQQLHQEPAGPAAFGLPIKLLSLLSL